MKFKLNEIYKLINKVPSTLVVNPRLIKIIAISPGRDIINNKIEFIYVGNNSLANVRINRYFYENGWFTHNVTFYKVGRVELSILGVIPRETE